MVCFFFLLLLLILPFKPFLQTFSQSLEKKPSLLPLKKHKKNKNQLPASCELLQVSLAQSVVWIEPCWHWVSPGWFLCVTMAPTITRVAAPSCSFTAWSLSAPQGLHILSFNLFSGHWKTKGFISFLFQPLPICSNVRCDYESFRALKIYFMVTEFFKVFN